MFRFAIPTWRAWAPGLASAQDWQQWASQPYCPSDDAAPPSPDYLPAAQRRRLGQLARAAIGCAWPLVERTGPVPMIYASHHGETTRGFDMLCALGSGQALSPLSFTASVHNAIAGLWSILREDHAEATALAVGADGAAAALAEACLLLDDAPHGVVVVLAEERPPMPYRPWIHDAPFPYAVALRVQRGEDFELAAGQDGDDAAPYVDAPHAGRKSQCADDDSHVLPAGLELLRHLLLRTPHWRHAGRRHTWQWRRCV